MAVLYRIRGNGCDRPAYTGGTPEGDTVVNLEGLRAAALTEENTDAECARLVDMMMKDMEGSRSMVRGHNCTTVSASVFELYCDARDVPCRWVAEDFVTVGLTYAALLRHEEAR